MSQVLPSFIHLRCHTEFSLSDGLCRVSDLVGAAVSAQMPAVAITDISNLFAMIKFYSKARAAGIKPIFGADLWLHNPQESQKPFLFTALCQNAQGYKHLTQLISRAYKEGQSQSQSQGKPQVQREWLIQYAAGLIILSGNRYGDIGRALLAKQPAQAVEYAMFWQKHFPRAYFLELTRTGGPDERVYEPAVLSFAEKHELPVVATNEVCFLKSQDFEAHEARVCIHSGEILADPHRTRFYTEQQYFKTPEEMSRLFSDIPSALSNTVEIAKRCNVPLTLGENYLPRFPIPADMTVESYLNRQAEMGLEKRLPLLMDVSAADFSERRAVYDERLRNELNVINEMGFPGYFLIVAEFIQWARDHHIPVGPGRGSGAGSLVAYALGITDLDPLAYDLLFERFLNPERVSMPDFDIDFCMEGRDRVIEHVVETYGANSVAQIITFGTMAAKAVVRDVGRVLAYPYGFVDSIAKLIPFELGITLEKALDQEETLSDRYKKEDDVRTLIDLALQLEGTTRNVGTHAGGIVIAPSDLTDFTPLYCESDAAHVMTQFDKDDVESVGLVKFDFLGLRTLTIIDWALQNINAQRKISNESNQSIDIARIPMDDADTFTLLKDCRTLAVFQLESRGMRDLVKRLQPDCFEDIVALVALFRPGPLQSGMVDDFINRKHGRAQVEYFHPALQTILKPTYGVILYQEQVMQIAQVLAGYSLGEADLLRRAMGKKKPEEMAKQRAIFLDGANQRKIDPKVAARIFDLMEKFAGYGFNKSHSAAYALLAYQTAWLKAHYPAAFMAAVLSSEMDNQDKIVRLIAECKDMGIEVLHPDVQHSTYRFSPKNPQQIIFGLGAIKGAGESAIETLIVERQSVGLYRDLFDLCARLDPRKANRRLYEALIKSGACDSLGTDRASLLASLDRALKLAEQQSRDRDAGQVDLFAAVSTSTKTAGEFLTSEFVKAQPWSRRELLQYEKETLGYYLSGHPIEPYREELAEFTVGRLSDLRPDKDKLVTVAGFVTQVRFMMTKKGKRMAVFTIEDSTAHLDVTLFSEVLNEVRGELQTDRFLVVDGHVDKDDFTGGVRMVGTHLRSMEEARLHYATGFQITLSPEQLDNNRWEQLVAVMSENKGGQLPVSIIYQHPESNAVLKVSDEWSLPPTDEVIEQLQTVLGVPHVKVCY